MRPALLALSAAGLLMTAAAPTSTPPRYDVDHFCQITAGRYGGEPAKNQCIGTEQYFYDWLKRNWLAVDPELREECLRGQKPPGQSYQGLQICFKNQLPRSRANGGQPFRY